MPLQFQPPPDWLMQEYVNRKNPAQEGLDSALNVANLYGQRKLQQQALSSLDAQRKANEFKVIAEHLKPEQVPAVARQYGINIPEAQAAPATAPALSPEMQPTAGTTPAGSSSPIIDHWNQTMGGQNMGGQMPGMAGSQPPTPTGRPSMSPAEMKTYRRELQDKKLERDLATDPNAPVPYLSDEDALKAGSGNPRAKIIHTAGQAEKDQKREDRMASAITDYGKQIETNPIVRKLNEQQIGIHDVEEMGHLVADGNTVASSAMGTKMAKAMGEVGVLTEQDVKRYVQSGKLSQAAGDTLSRWVNGTPSNATLAEVNQIASVLNDSFEGKIQPIYNRYVERFSRAHKIDPEEAAYKLAIPYKKARGGGISGGAMPEVGGTFEGGRVLSIKKVSK